MTKLNLFCLPFAGGSAYAYRGLVEHAPAGLNVVPVELPGRGRRCSEPLITDVHRMTADVLDQVRQQLDQPYAIFGHSMGAVLGYLLIKQILREGLPAPRQLFVSGRGGPSARPGGTPFHLLPREELYRRLQKLGGIADEVLTDENLMRFFEPIIRADFRATETYKYQPSGPFDIPVLVMIGISERVTYREALLWQQETTAPLVVRQFPGQHFFIFQYEKEIMGLIGQCLHRNPKLSPEGCLRPGS